MAVRKTVRELKSRRRSVLLCGNSVFEADKEQKDGGRGKHGKDAIQERRE